MAIFYLNDEELYFPHPELALAEGLLAVGGDLSPERLITAYSFGIFPWYNEDSPILWWSPNPRFILYPDELKVSKSMRPYFNQQKYTVTIDTYFPEVLTACQRIERKDQDSTWITYEMHDAYCKLHEMGYAHSVEVWKGDQLAGGLYGISLGNMFFGESMFALAPNASKFALISLVKILKAKGFTLIDCQQETAHLASLGARTIDRKEFLKQLRNNRMEASFVGKWTNWATN